MTKPTSPDDNKQVANRAMVQAAVLAAVEDQAGIPAVKGGRR